MNLEQNDLVLLYFAIALAVFVGQVVYARYNKDLREDADEGTIVVMLLIGILFPIFGMH